MMFSEEQNNEAFQNFNYNVASIMLPTREYTVNYKIGDSIVKKQSSITAEKIDFKGLVQIRLAEKDDQTRMFISTIDTTHFTQLKKDQSLHVTFSGFVDNLIKIFNECQQGNLQINLIRDKGSSNNQFLLQFYEVRSFKNLIHLCLPIREAPLQIVLFHMNQTLRFLQKQNETYSTSLEYSQKEIEKNLMHISQLQKDNEKLKINLKEQENLNAMKNQEEIYHLQDNIRKLKEEFNLEERRLKQIITNSQSEIENLKIDNLQMHQEKMKLMKKTETLNEEMCILKSNVANLKEQNEKLNADNASLRNLERKNEIYMNDLKKQFQEMHEKLRKYDKVKSELLAEIEAEKKLCHSKRTALNLATEELAKANSLITKQRDEIAKLKNSIDWRTEIALKQEILVNEKDKEITKQNEQLIKLQNEIKNIRNESNKFYEHLENIKHLADKIENKYNEKIREFNKNLTS